MELWVHFFRSFGYMLFASQPIAVGSMALLLKRMEKRIIQRIEKRKNA